MFVLLFFLFAHKELQMVVRRNECGFSCKKIWDGHGVWSKEGNLWKPYKKLASIKQHTNEKKKTKHGLSWLLFTNLNADIFKYLIVHAQFRLFTKREKGKTTAKV